MKNILRNFVFIVWAVALLPVNVSAQNRRDKEQTYVLEQPYEVTKITPSQGKKIKNVILMIGDGMSLMHVYSAWTANRGKLFLDNCQAVGLSKTYCADKLITDSGAGGTAIASGQKTNYHYVGVDTLGHPLKSLVDFAASKNATVIVKGLRTVADFEYEFQMALLNKALNPEYETMFMMTNTKYSYISSSMVKELAGFHGDLTGLVPCEIIETIEEKYK